MFDAENSIQVIWKMNSIAIGCQKQVPDAVQISSKKSNAQKTSVGKITPPKTKQDVSKVVRFNKLMGDNQPYTPLEASILSAKPASPPTGVIPINWDAQLCTTRGALVTFMIIFILIAAAGASVGIVFAAINSRSSSGSSSNNSNQNSFTTAASTGVLTSSVSIGSQTGLPCSGYTTINDPSRSANLTGPSESCDNGPLFNTSNGGSWIRFVGTGGTNLALSSPGVQHCGAFLPGWLNDTLPSTVNLVTSGTVCFDTDANECGYFLDISIVYCSGNFFVYFLPPIPICNSRYCTA